MLNKLSIKIADALFMSSVWLMLLALTSCELTDHVLPNPDAGTLYTEPYIGLAQLNSVDSRRLTNAQVLSLRGKLEADARNLELSQLLVPNAASVSSAPPRKLSEQAAVVDYEVFDPSKVSGLADRQREADVNLGIYREASDRARELSDRLDQVENRRTEQLRRIEEANQQLSEAKIVEKREVEAVPQPKTPSQLSDLLKQETQDEQFLALLYFGSGSDELGPREREVVKALAAEVDPRGWRLIVRGYDSGSLANRTQADRIRSLRLSRSRANAVKDLLVQLGYPEEKISAQGFGDQEPVFPELSDVGVFGNQRVQISGVREQD